jgi:hypothetical protein
MEFLLDELENRLKKRWERLLTLPPADLVGHNSLALLLLAGMERTILITLWVINAVRGKLLNTSCNIFKRRGMKLFLTSS